MQIVTMLHLMSGSLSTLCVDMCQPMEVDLLVLYKIRKPDLACQNTLWSSYFILVLEYCNALLDRMTKLFFSSSIDEPESGSSSGLQLVKKKPCHISLDLTPLALNNHQNPLFCRVELQIQLNTPEPIRVLLGILELEPNSAGH